MHRINHLLFLVVTWGGALGVCVSPHLVGRLDLIIK
jgi:hypothetical protein